MSALWPRDCNRAAKLSERGAGAHPNRSLDPPALAGVADDLHCSAGRPPDTCAFLSVTFCVLRSASPRQQAAERTSAILNRFETKRVVKGANCFATHSREMPSGNSNVFAEKLVFVTNLQASVKLKTRPGADENQTGQGRMLQSVVGHRRSERSFRAITAVPLTNLQPVGVAL